MINNFFFPVSVGGIMNNNVTILVNSCDLYEDTWYTFFKLLQIQWPKCPYKKVLHTETKEYTCPFFEVKTVKTGKDLSWTARLKKALEQIDTEYVLFFLEDFFLLSEVRVEAFNKALDIIDNNPDIGLIHFTPTEKNMPTPNDDLDNCFYELPIRKRTLRTRVAVSLFRKDYLLKLLYKDENPWQYERESHIRSMFAGYKIIRQDYSLYPPTFHYCLDHDIGIGVTSRKWLKNNKSFFESMGIYDVNYDNLGVFSNESYQKMKDDKANIKIVGFKEWFYVKFKQPIKRKLRHSWLIQDILNFKKYIKYWMYYKFEYKN